MLHYVWERCLWPHSCVQQFTDQNKKYWPELISLSRLPKEVVIKSQNFTPLFSCIWNDAWVGFSTGVSTRNTKPALPRSSLFLFALLSCSDPGKNEYNFSHQMLKSTNVRQITIQTSLGSNIDQEQRWSSLKNEHNSLMFISCFETWLILCQVVKTLENGLWVQ